MKVVYEKFVQFVQKHRRMNRAKNELSKLSNRELADLGITRNDIEFVIRQTYK